MPRHARGPYLWLRPARQRARGSDPALWIIRDAGHQHSTGFSVGDRGEAERRLAEYIAGKYAPARRERDIAEIPVAGRRAQGFSNSLAGLWARVQAASRSAARASCL
ncbi:MAG TPA: hypothetical protein VFE60_01245 [Roseiarcus sp.]|nr:hypothetical protein [Roseiarcus sp.]